MAGNYGNYSKYTQDQRAYQDRNRRYYQDWIDESSQAQFGAYVQNQFEGNSHIRNAEHLQNQYGGYRQHPYRRHRQRRQSTKQYRCNRNVKNPSNEKAKNNQGKKESGEPPIPRKENPTTNIENFKQPPIVQKTNLVKVESPEMPEKTKSKVPSTSTISSDSSCDSVEQKKLNRESKLIIDKPPVTTGTTSTITSMAPNNLKGTSLSTTNDDISVVQPDHLLTASKQPEGNDSNSDSVGKPLEEITPDALTLYNKVLAETYSIEAIISEPKSNVTKVTAKRIRDHFKTILELVLKENFSNEKLTLENNRLIKTNQQLENIIIHLKDPILTQGPQSNKSTANHNSITPDPQEFMTVLNKYFNAKRGNF